MLRFSRPHCQNINPALSMLDRDHRVKEDKNESILSEIGLFKLFLGHWTSIS
jgi:hypothetical protein